ncbi:hypothetical protein [Sinomonas sp. R1AF57]|uniref:hypothetical protein n=1 Tax=Sinomonas sp. R1AF57 TaxID=2020377 RepID=UPI0021010D36|nr:hypothetical protein [Sinomonas sp. R1AF57]
MPTQRQISVRRAPKYVPFLVAGGIVGVVAAAFVSFTVPAPADYTQESVFGYFMVLFAAGGVLVGAIVALVLDRLSVRRTQRAVVEEVDDDQPAATAPAATDDITHAAAEGEPTHDGGAAPSSADGTGVEGDGNHDGTERDGR